MLTKFSSWYQIPAVQFPHVAHALKTHPNPFPAITRSISKSVSRPIIIQIHIQIKIQISIPIQIRTQIDMHICPVPLRDDLVFPSDVVKVV